MTVAPRCCSLLVGVFDSSRPVDVVVVVVDRTAAVRLRLADTVNALRSAEVAPVVRSFLCRNV